MAQSLNALAVGALVKDTGTLYNGKPIIWKIADKGHTGYPSGAVTLITERIISLKCFDAIESGNSDGNRRSLSLYTHLRAHETAATAFGAYFKLNSFIFMPVFGMNNVFWVIIA